MFYDYQVALIALLGSGTLPVTLSSGTVNIPVTNNPSGNLSAYPYVVVGDMTELPFDTSSNTGSEFVTNIHAWTNTINSELIRKTQDEIKSRLHRVDVSITGYKTYLHMVEYQNVMRDPDPDNVIYHGITRVRIIFHP